MTSQNRPHRGRRGGSSRPGSGTPRRQLYAAVRRLDLAIQGLPFGEQTDAYVGHGRVIRQFTNAVHDRVSAGQTQEEM
jgi:hypothetical protein